MTRSNEKLRLRKTELDPRKLMQQAIDIMRQSIHEPRTDKRSPSVGAVLVKADGTIETAFRGELRYGDHAEFALLERKNRNVRLDDAVLFTTLEPCAPGARHPPKLGCAERIFLARIKLVYVGVEDPDPTVDRKGIRYLEENGVTVKMFDRDLQDIIYESNKEYFQQALQRSEEKKNKTISLSSLENPSTAVLDDLSAEALKQYRNIAKIGEPVTSPEFNRRLINQGLVQLQQNGQLAPTGFGTLLFGKEPRTVMPQAGLLATINYPDGSEEVKTFDGPMVLVPDAVEKWLGDKLPNVVDRSHMRRERVPALPFEMIREAVVNALVHRDYDIGGAKCQLIVTNDTVTVKSPGGPLAPITLEQLQSFSAPMLSRNPQLHYVFAQMGMAEERGLGITTLRKRAEQLQLPLPKYSMEDPYLVLKIYRMRASAVRTLPPKTANALNDDEKAGWEFISTRSFITAKVYAEHMGYDMRKAQRHLRRFGDLGLLKKIFGGRSTEYNVLHK